MYKCELCHLSLSRKDSLKRHTQIVHRKRIDSYNTPKRQNVGEKNVRHNNTHFGYGDLGQFYYRKHPSFRDIQHAEEATIFPKDRNQRKQEYSGSALKWKHPFTCMIAGPTSCGKTIFTSKFLKHLTDLVNTNFVQIIYCAPKSSYPDLSECEIPVRYIDWIPDAEMFSDKQARLIIIDDMMRESNEQVVDLFTKHSHHLGLSVIFITQNIFHKGKGMRDISLNAHYIVVFKSPRDRLQFAALARQISPGNTQFTNEVFEDATNTSYGYLIIDLTQTTPDHLRYRTNIFPDDKPHNIVYVPKNFVE